MIPNATRLGELASVIRSKNAGPFELTFDILFTDEAAFARVKASGAINAEAMARLYEVPVSDVLCCRAYDPALAFKFTLRRPTGSGDVHDSDVFGCQQHVPLVDLPVPAAGIATAASTQKGE